MKYDRYIDYEDTDKWHTLETLFFDWEDVGIPKDYAMSRGFAERYRYRVPLTDMVAVIKAGCVEDRGMTPKKAEKHINKSHINDTHLSFVNEAFEEYAHKAMRSFRSDKLSNDEWRDYFYSDSGRIPKKFDFGYDGENKTFGYDEFVPEAEEYLKDHRWRYNYEVHYGCKEMGFNPNAVFVAGYDPIGERFNANGYTYWSVPDVEMFAALKCCLVHVGGKNPDDVSMEYIDKNHYRLQDKYDVYVRRAFFEEACGDHDNVCERMENALARVPVDDRPLPEDLLSWKPRSGYRDFPPKEVYDARMSLLSPEDRKRLETVFEYDDPILKENYLNFKYNFFNEDNSDNVYGNILNGDFEDMADFCCECYLDGTEKDVMRLFKASAMYDRLRKTNGKFSCVDSDGKKHTIDVAKRMQNYIKRELYSMKSHCQTVSEDKLPPCDGPAK
ncbi:MAG: hypothetical protein LUD72_01905 [Bacteroidales bacterium]|nr:hypothetical protein [Bacteroidales bacterium]